MKPAYVIMIVASLFSAVPILAADAPQSVSNMGNVKGGDVKAAHSVIDTKCTTCHSRKVIDEAIQANKDMSKIQQRMEKKGARLNSNEQEVLGIYWKQNPLKSGK